MHDDLWYGRVTPYYLADGSTTRCRDELMWLISFTCEATVVIDIVLLRRHLAGIIFLLSRGKSIVESRNQLRFKCSLATRGVCVSRKYTVSWEHFDLGCNFDQAPIFYSLKSVGIKMQFYSIKDDSWATRAIYYFQTIPISDQSDRSQSNQNAK